MNTSKNASKTSNIILAYTFDRAAFALGGLDFFFLETSCSLPTTALPFHTLGLLQTAQPLTTHTPAQRLQWLSGELPVIRLM